MPYTRPIRLWLALAVLPGAALPGQDRRPAASPDAPYSCADTSLARWLPSDTSARRSKVDARYLLEHSLARTYAPILRFAPSERYFPTIPFWTAFLDIPRGIATPSGKLGRPRPDGSRPALPAISAVRDAYDQALDLSARPYELKLPLPVVFYRVCDLIAPDPDSASWVVPRDDSAAGRKEERRWRSKSHYLWDYLRSDEQAWRRFFLETARTSDTSLTDSTPAPRQRPGSLIRHISRFHVIQFFVYYLQDWGLLGHSEDIEYAFVFVPVDSSAAKSFRVVVGAGHDPPAPNNVLVMVSRDASKPRHFHPNILVELGGHSSAPDMPPFGQFSAGLDVNWHIDDLWGTRDEQATAGLSFSGRYEGTMTYPRDPEDAVTLFPRGFGSGADSSRQVLADLVRVSPDYLAERAHRAGHLPNPPSAERRELAEEILHAYRASLEASEAELQTAVGKSDSTKAVLKQVPDTSDVYQAEIGKALKEDALTRDTALQSIDEKGHERVVRSIDSLIRAARCPDSLRAHDPMACPSWLADSLDRKVRQAVQLLENGSGRIPADSLMAQLLDSVPEPAENKTPLDAITSEIRAVVTERLQPEYSLLPIRYLQALYKGAVDSNPELVRRQLKLITRLLHPATCVELACGLPLKRGDAFDSAFDEVVCGLRGDRTTVAGSVLWPRSLACHFDPITMMDSIRLWDNDVYDLRDPAGKTRQWPAHKHKIWEHLLYRQPELIFRTDLFRPTATQVKHSRGSLWGLLHLGYTLDFGRASNPYLGIIFPARLGLPFKIPGYLALQAGPYLAQPWRERKVMPAISLLYDRQFVYFYGLFLKAQWVNRRSDTEGGSGASDFAWTFGASLWAPPLRRLHVRPGIRFDTEDLRPLLDRTVWELQIEYRR